MSSLFFIFHLYDVQTQKHLDWCWNFLTSILCKPTVKPLTRVHSVGGHSFPLSDASQLLTEVDVGQLAAAVGEEGQQVVVEVLEVQFLVLVAGACKRDHPAGGAFFQARQKQIGEEEVTQVIDTETHAEAIIRPVEDTGHTWGRRQK